MSRKSHRRIENELKKLILNSPEKTIPFPNYFPPSDFYPIPVSLLAQKEARKLYFLDHVFEKMDEHGLIEINYDNILARGGLRERTLEKYLKELETQNWIVSWEKWLLQRAEAALVGTDWDILSQKEKRYYIDKVASSERRTKLFYVTHKFLRSELLYKPVNYIRRGWSDYRKDLAVRQVINGLFLGFNRKQNDSKKRLYAFEMNVWELKRWTKIVHGGRSPAEFQAAVDTLTDDQLLLILENNHLKFEMAGINRKVPIENPADRKQRLRRDICRKFGLDEQTDKERITLLTNLVERGIIPERKIGTFLNVLENNHPLLLQEREFKKMVDWMVAQHDVGRTLPLWKQLIMDYKSARVSRVPEILGTWSFRFVQRTADGDIFTGDKERPKVTSFVLRWRAQPKRLGKENVSVIRVGVLRDTNVHLLERNWKRPGTRFYLSSDVSAVLKRLKNEEHVVIFSVVDNKHSKMRLEVTLLGYF